MKCNQIEHDKGTVPLSPLSTFSQNVPEGKILRHSTRYDVRNRIVRSLEGMSPGQIELLEEQIRLMKRMFGI